MAKSLRSKRRRKMRAEKRIVNAKKELVKLKQIASKLHGGKEGVLTKEALEAQIPGVQVCPADALLEQQQQQQQEAMQIDSGDSNGPSTPGAAKASKKEQMRINTQWMNQRKIKSIKSKIKKHNQKKTRKGKSAGLSSRKAKKSIKK